MPNVRPRDRRDRRDRDARSQTAVVAIVLLLAPPHSATARPVLLTRAVRRARLRVAAARGHLRGGHALSLVVERAAARAEGGGWWWGSVARSLMAKNVTPRKRYAIRAKIHGAAGARALATPRRVRSGPASAAAAAAVRGCVGARVRGRVVGQVVCGGRAGKWW